MTSCRWIYDADDGEDSYRCSLEEGHFGLHIQLGTYPVRWDEDTLGACKPTLAPRTTEA